TCHPYGVKMTVALSILPGIGLVSRNLTHPILGSFIADHFALIDLTARRLPMKRKVSSTPFLLGRGNLALPAKKFAKAPSRSLRACCWQVWLTAAIQSTSARSIVNSRHC